MNLNQKLKSPASKSSMSFFGRKSKLSVKTSFIGPTKFNILTSQIKVKDDKINHKDYQIEEIKDYC